MIKAIVLWYTTFQLANTLRSRKRFRLAEFFEGATRRQTAQPTRCADARHVATAGWQQEGTGYCGTDK